MRSPVSALTLVFAAVLFCLSDTVLWGAEHRPVPGPDAVAETPAPGSAESDLNAAVSLLLQGEIDAAIDTVRRHLRRDPRAVDLLFEAGMAMLGSAQTTPPSNASGREALLDASIALFRAILAEHPDFARAPGTCPRLLPPGEGRLDKAALRACPCRQSAGTGRGQHQPLPCRNSRPQALERVFRHGAAARHEYRCRLGQ